MAALSDYLEKALLDHTLGGIPYSAPAARYVSLHTASPGETGTPSGEVVGGEYKRALAQFNTATLGSGTTTNSNSLAYTNMPAVTVSHIGIYDAPVQGNLMYYGALTTPVTVSGGGTFVINAGGLSVSLA